MPTWTSLQNFIQNFQGLGSRKQLALAIVTVAVLAAVGLVALTMSQPPMKTLYTGLSSSDVSRMTAVLSEAQIDFEVSSKGDALLVTPGKVTQARMLLAERGLPAGSSAGYELFDKLGSLGLTSFMQEITRKRALEGEIARTIQSMSGVSAARVHIVMEDVGSFRRKKQPPSASVVIRADSGRERGLATSIRHLVAAAVPGLSMENVTVLGTDGSMLAVGGNSSERTLENQVGLEGMVSRNLTRKVTETLTPFLGMGNFRISVAARLNTDKRETRETAYDPNSRVERSVRVVKETRKSADNKADKSVTVQENVPDQAKDAGGKTSSQKQNDRREELTNFEVGSKVTSTVSSGYKIERLTVAVVVNRARLEAVLGKNGSKGAEQDLLKQVEGLVSSATGLNAKRGDKITIAAVNFIPDASAMEPVPGRPLTEQLMDHLGSLINAAAVLLVAFLVIWFGVRPLTASLTQPRLAEASAAAVAELPQPGSEGANPSVEGAPARDAAPAQVAASAREPAAIAANAREHDPSFDPMQRLDQLLTNDEGVANVLRQWLNEGRAT